jgi:hypothetical protein
MTKTLIFCTSYGDSEKVWTTRYRLWVNAIRGGAIVYDHVLLVDDASPVIPEWPDVSVINAAGPDPIPGGITLFRFNQRLGRQGRTVYPGWYRSFCYAARFSELHGFDKIIHIESDGFIISRRMCDYINAFSEGWVAPAIQSHKMPESAIQVMAGDGAQSFIEFTRIPYSNHVGIDVENILPFTHIETAFVGSRYGETLCHVPEEADFVTQTNGGMAGKRGYYWWIQPEVFPFP